MLHRLETRQLLKTDLKTVWSFISDPNNLGSITPDYLGFHILPRGEVKKMHAGQILEYLVKPLFGIRIYWVTEITHVHQQQFFVDEQRFGPYQFWHHKHFLEPTDDGVMMTDMVHYKLPLGILGRLANWLFVRRKLEEIFNHRYRQLDRLFNQQKMYSLAPQEIEFDS